MKYQNIAEKYQPLQKEHGLLQDENNCLRSTVEFQRRFPLINAYSIPFGTMVRARIRERQEHHHTRRWFERQMIAESGNLLGIIQAGKIMTEEDITTVTSRDNAH